MPRYTFCGIDPGVVDTGIVWVTFDTDRRTATSHYHVVHNGRKCTPEQIAQEVEQALLDHTLADHVFIEEYRPRTTGFVASNNFMTQLQQELRRNLTTSATIVSNSGVNKLVPNRMLNIFKLRVFPVSTNHQDLKSAAKILLLGLMRMLSDDSSERRFLLYDVITDHLAGNPWNVAEPVLALKPTEAS